MTDVKMVITKSATWRGATEEYGNVYTFSGFTPDDTVTATALVDQFVAAEKLCHGNVVSFVRAQIFSYGSVGPNFMYHTQNLTGIGALTSTASMYREIAIMLRCKLPRTYSMTRSNQPYLRKFFHTCASVGVDLTGAAAPGFAAPNASFASIVSAMNNPYGDHVLMGESGALPIGSWEQSFTAQHRQFRRGRKEY